MPFYFYLATIGGIRKKRLHLFTEEHMWRYNNRALTRNEQVQKLHRILVEFGGRK
jgi:hypothetical protein